MLNEFIQNTSKFVLIMLKNSLKTVKSCLYYSVNVHCIHHRVAAIEVNWSSMQREELSEKSKARYTDYR